MNTILIVEDDLVISLVLKQILVRLHYLVSGNGYSAGCAIHKLSSTPIIYMSGSVVSTLWHEKFPGEDAILSKPFKSKDVENVLKIAKLYLKSVPLYEKVPFPLNSIIQTTHPVLISYT